jgi:hypothetical protein
MTVQNVDAGQLEGPIKQYNDSPDSYPLDIEAKTTWEG